MTTNDDVSLPPAAELRTDPLTGAQVFVAAGRDRRPIQTPQSIDSASTFAVSDPFADGSESDTPAESLSLRRNGSAADEPGWLVRVVPNRYPAVAQIGEVTTGATSEATSILPARGLHEVVIECPDFRSSLAELSVVEIARVLTAWQLRVRHMVRLPGIDCIHLFRNEGRDAGASLPHCHSQILALAKRDPALVNRLLREQGFRSSQGKSLFATWLKDELHFGRRILLDGPFVVVCPIASQFAMQIRVCSSANEFQFHQLPAEDVATLAGILLSVARTLRQVCDNPAMNIVVTLPPIGDPLFPWMIDFLPRTARLAGFELSSGIHIVTVSPESAAARFRDAIHWQPACDADEIVPSDCHWLDSTAEPG